MHLQPVCPESRVCYHSELTLNSSGSCNISHGPHASVYTKVDFYINPTPERDQGAILKTRIVSQQPSLFVPSIMQLHVSGDRFASRSQSLQSLLSRY